MLRYAAATVGVPVEVLVADYRQANFSVSRMAEMHAENAVRPWRNLFRERFLIPIYRWRLARLVADGRLPASDLEAALAVKWPAPPRQFIDPTKEVPALREMIEQNLITKREVVERYGGDWEQIVAARAQEVRDEAAAGITPPTMPGSTVAAAQPPPEPPPEPDDQDDDSEDESSDDADA
jgi:capsid protein